MSSKTDYKERLDITRVMKEPGEWNTTTNTRNNLVKTAVFDSFFSYLTITANDANIQLDYDVSPTRIINEMMKRTEIEIMRNLANFKVLTREEVVDDEEQD